MPPAIAEDNIAPVIFISFMAVIITKTSLTPEQLLAEFKRLIDAQTIRTWRYTNNHFFFKAAQWANEAYFVAVCEPTKEELRFGLRPLHPINKKIGRDVYGVFHGHLILEFLTHLYPHFSFACGSAQKMAPDDFEWKP
jgi:hypothetical protein